MSKTKNMDIQQILEAVLKDSRLQKTVATIVEDFLNRAHTQAAEQYSNRDWTALTDGALRQAYHYRRRKGKEIEPALAAEMARRFSGFDIVTQTFLHRGWPSQARAKQIAQNPYRDLTKNELAAKHALLVMDGEEIDDDLNAEMKRRFPRYDAKKRRFRENRRGGANKKSLRDVTDSTLRTQYYQARRAGKITVEMNNELARRFPEYDPTEKKFQSKRGGYTHSFIKQPTAQKADATAISELVVEKKLLKMSPDGMYYDVFVNGTRILHNHVDTEIKTFLDGTILGIHGIATEITDLPTRPTWQIYDANLTRRVFNQRDWFTKKDIYIQSATETSNGQLDLWASNKMHQYLNKKDLGRIFKIMEEKQK